MRLTQIWLAVFVIVLVPAQAAVGMRAAETASITGDEPFYLLTAQSLVSDGDLDLRDEYAYPEREMARFWDGRVALWKQMEPAPDGRLLAPHDPGLPLLVAPAHALGGLQGVQRFLVVVWAAAMATAACLATTVLGAASSVYGAGRAQFAWLSGLAAVAVGIGAPGIVYASQVYPEGPAALCVALGLAVAGGTRPRPVAMAAVAIALAWLGVKYVPVAVVLAAVWAWRFRADRRGVLVTALLGGAAAVHYGWWHLATFGGLTPYSANVMWAGEADASILADHLDVADRLYRIHGLFLDARFGLFRWLPIAVLAVAGVARAARATALHVAVIATCVAMGTFASITIMGWWFPGRMLVAGLPALVVLVAAGAARWPRAAAVLGAWSVAIGLTVAWAAHTGRILLAIAPFSLGPPLAPHWLFPDFRELEGPEVLMTTVWFAGLAGLLLVTRWRRSCSSTATRSRTGPSSRSRPTWRRLAGR